MENVLHQQLLIVKICSNNTNENVIKNKMILKLKSLQIKFMGKHIGCFLKYELLKSYKDE